MDYMCGFVGFNFEDIILAKKMCDVIAHRGPDGEGYYANTNVTLGHRRLSIIDLQKGGQPIFNEDGSIVVVYNGEIYNFQDLRLDLEKRGHQFSTDSDTEVIVHTYEEYGYECVQYFNGMFAFALYDQNKDLLFLARDRLGIKPLHYTCLDDGRILFGSEIKALLQYKQVKREMDPQSLHYILNLRYIPGERTMFRRIKRLLPGHSMIVKSGEMTIIPYYQLTYRAEDHSEDYYIKTTRKLLEESVRRHLISDVPVGIMLSGGIDSSSIVALASTMVDEPIQTFCMGFGNENDENSDAQRIADHFGTDHHSLIVSDNLLKDYPKMIWYADEPKRNLYPYYISEVVSKHVKTVLGGLGGDELFGGYVFKYNFVKKIESIRNRTMYETRKQMAEIADRMIHYQTRYGDNVDDLNLDYLETIRNIQSNTDLYLITQTLDKVFTNEYLEKIYGPEMLKRRLDAIRDIYLPIFNDEKPFIDQLQIADTRMKLADDFLLVDDRMNMAHSLESRVPFLDTHLVDFAFRIPSEMKLQDPNGKHILKMAMKDILPDFVLKKEKQGFASSSYTMYLRGGRDLAQQILSDGCLTREKYISQDYVDSVLHTLPNPRLDLHYTALWNLMVSELWYRIFIESECNTPNITIDRLL